MAVRNMDEQYRLDLIGKKSASLSDACKSFPFNQLGMRLVEFGTLVSNDLDEMDALSPSYAKYARLFSTLPSRKGRQALNNLVMALIMTENATAVEILTGKTIEELEEVGIHKFVDPNDFTIHVVKQGGVLRVQSIALKGAVPAPQATALFANPNPVVNPQNPVAAPDDFSLHTTSQLLKIGDILQQTPRISERWSMVAKELLGEAKAGFDTNNLNKLPELWIADTLEHWIGIRGDAATLNKLIACLRSRNCVKGADDLEKNREIIRGATKN